MSDQAVEQEVPLGGDFVYFVTRMGLQALIALGALENPLTGERNKNLDQARMIARDLEMLLDKTRGNLSLDEEAKLREVLERLEQNLRD